MKTRFFSSLVNFLRFLFAAEPSQAGQMTSRIKDHPMLLASYGWPSTQFNAILIMADVEIVLKPP